SRRAIDASRPVRAISRTPSWPPAASIPRAPTRRVAAGSRTRRGPHLGKAVRRFAINLPIAFDCVPVGDPTDEVGDVTAALRLFLRQRLKPSLRQQRRLTVISRE